MNPDERRRRIEHNLVKEPHLSRRESQTARLEERMAMLGVPGISIAVINLGQIEWARGYGVREDGMRDPVTTETLFQAASISKPVTAIATLRLVDQGLLDLDEDVNHYLTSWKVPPNGSWQPRVTIRHILTHGAGLTGEGFPGYLRTQPIPTAVQILDGTSPANTDPVRVDTLPGLQFRYAGGGTTVLQQLLTDIVGQPFPALMRDLVLDPLGMRNSTYEQPLPEARWSVAASGHQMGGGVVAGQWHVYPELAAAGLWTTPTDLARLVIEIQAIRGGASNGLLSRDTVNQMLTPQLENRYGWTTSIGLGFFLDGEGETQRFSHGGDNHGFKALLTAYSDQGLGAIVMTNGDSGGELNNDVMRTVAREYGWTGYTPTQPAALEPAQASVAHYVGTYELKPGIQFRLALEGMALMLHAPGQQPIRLSATSPTTFFTEVANVEIEVVQAQHGDAPAIKLRQNGSELVATKVDE